jgi:hypothetical protein
LWKSFAINPFRCKILSIIIASVPIL